MQLVMFGRVGMLRDYCEKCKRDALVIDGKMACCDLPIKANQSINSIKRECVTFDVRRLNKWQKDYILERQNYSCFYCHKRFGSECFYKGKIIKIKTHFDHIIPMAYQGDNSLPNLVAACAQCNQWKCAQIFSSIEECRVFMMEKWNQHRDAPLAKKASRVKVVKYGVEQKRD